MTHFTQAGVVRDFRIPRKDVGVLIVLSVALALAYLLRSQIEGRTSFFQDQNTPFALTYPTAWRRVDTPEGALLKVENPRTDSTFKTALTVESRALDTQSPPTLQQLLDRRVKQHGTLTGYHLLAQPQEEQIDMAKAMFLEYAYIVQPIDEPRRASLPVVVHALEYIVVTKENVFYITLAAPEIDFAAAAALFDEMLETVNVQ